VHRRARGLGLASSLMAALEAEARRLGRTLLLLDTQTGSVAESVYLRWGWEAFGTVPDHARLPDGRLADTTYMLKRLAPG
jgi:acetyltransferase